MQGLPLPLYTSLSLLPKILASPPDLTIGSWCQLDNGVQRKVDVRDLLRGVVHEVANYAPHHGLHNTSINNIASSHEALFLPDGK